MWTPHWWSVQRSLHALINTAFTLLAKLAEVDLFGELDVSILISTSISTSFYLVICIENKFEKYQD
jgi:hypothetical protein